DVRWCETDAETRARSRFTGAQRRESRLQLCVGGEREIEAITEAVRVDPDDRTIGGDDRASRRTARKRCGVLEAALDPATSRSAKGPLRAADHPERHPLAAGARPTHDEHDLPDAR